MITEWWLRKKIFHISENFLPVQDFDQLTDIRWPAIIALLAGLIVGIATSGLFPAFEFCHFGISALNAWLTSIIFYIPLRIHENTKNEQKSHV